MVEFGSQVGLWRDTVTLLLVVPGPYKSSFALEMVQEVYGACLRCMLRCMLRYMLRCMLQCMLQCMLRCMLRCMYGACYLSGCFSLILNALLQPAFMIILMSVSTQALRDSLILFSLFHPHLVQLHPNCWIAAHISKLLLLPQVISIIFFIVSVAWALSTFPQDNIPSAQGQHNAHKGIGILCIALVGAQVRKNKNCA